MAKENVLDALNEVMHAEFENAVRNLYHSFFLRGVDAAPVREMFREEATDSVKHCLLVGEKIMSLGGEPRLRASVDFRPENHGLERMVREAIGTERRVIEAWKRVAESARDNIALKALAETTIQSEQAHVDELARYIGRAAGEIPAAPAGEGVDTQA